jgi:flagellar biogenesis protein FliO
MRREWRGVAGWLIKKLHPGDHRHPELELIEKISLGPRHSLALVAAAGNRILVAFSNEGGPVFFPLPEKSGSASGGRSIKRLSW